LSKARKSITADQVLVRKMNRSTILEELRTCHALSRSGLAANTGLNASTVSNIVNDLLNEKLIRETDWQQPDIGRPRRMLEINPEGGCALGVEINVDYLLAILTDFTASVLWKKRVSISPDDSLEEIITKLETLIQEGISTDEASRLNQLGIGVGVPGLVDYSNGVLRVAPNLGWYDVPLLNILRNRFQVPIIVENEANAAALGEYYFGAAHGVENFIFLSAGYGLGGGIVLDGKLFRGSHGYASELGHVTFDAGGEICGCGNRGCWETFVGPRVVERNVRRTLRTGAASIMRRMAEGELEQVTFDIVLEAAHQGDEVALSALHENGRYLGIGVANLINIFNPEMVVLGGALNLASPFILPVIEQTLEANALPPNKENVSIVASTHQTDASVMGAVALVLDEVLREPALFFL
jgi:glucokinase-like ROK family protein